MRVRAALALAGLLALAGASACTSAPTQLLVHVGSDLPLDVEPPVAGDRVLRAVRVEVCEPSCDRLDAPRVERRWAVGRDRVQIPFSFGVAPSDPASPGRAEIRVEALRVASDDARPEDVLFATRRITAFAPGRRLDVHVFLSAGCVGMVCPEGTACGDEGQCVPVGDRDAGAGPMDGGADAPAAADAGLDAGLTVGLDAGLDAGASDGGVLDAPSPDASAADAGLDAPVADAAGDGACALPTSDPFPSTLVAERDQGFRGGYVTSVAEGAPSVRLAAGVYLTTGTSFTWEDASATGPTHFVSRVDGVARWTVFPRVVGTYDYSSRLTALAERDGVVYAAGTRVEGWTLSVGGSTLTLPALPTDTESSLRAGVTLLALDATTGRPLWARTLETEGASDYLAGMAVDDGGVVLAWRTTPSATSTLGTLRVDGTVRALDAGPADGRVRLARLDSDGAVLWIRAVGGASFSGLSLAGVGDGDTLVSMHVARWLGGRTTLDGLGASSPAGELVVARLDPSGDARWATAARCATGSWSPRSAALAYANGRAFPVFLATTPTMEAECSAIAVGSGGPSDPVLVRGETGGAWLGALALDTCDGSLAVASLFSAAVNPSPAAVVSGASADARSLAITGYVGSGGLATSSGSFAGRDPGMGTDGILLVLSPDVAPRFTRILGSTRAVISGADDYGAAIDHVGDTLHVALGLTEAQALDGITIDHGARLVRFGLR